MNNKLHLLLAALTLQAALPLSAQDTAELGPLLIRAKAYDAEALRLLTDACEGEHPRLHGEQALEVLRLAASAGITKAQALLACCYQQGKWTQEDTDLAVILAEKVRKSQDAAAIKLVESIRPPHEQYAESTDTYTPPPAQTAAQGEAAELNDIIRDLENMYTRDATQALYRKRLLTLLPRIRNGSPVDLTLTETKGNTALHYACGMGNLRLVRWLVRNGANPHVLTNKGKSPWDCASGDVAAIRRALSETRSVPQSPRPTAYVPDETASYNFRMGINYQFAKNGYSRNYTEAVRYYRMAAEAGHPTAQNNLGQMYNMGWGVQQDKRMAFYWWTKAAEQGQALAQSNLGTCYEFGNGTSVNKAKAIEWYRKSAAQGNASGQKHLRRLGISY